MVPLGSAILDVFEGIIGGAAAAFGWIPGLGPKLKDAASAFGTFKEDTLEKLRNMGDAALGANEKIDRLNKVRILKADIASWNSELSDARAQLKRTTDQKAIAKLTADIRELEAKVKRAKGKVDELNGRTSNMYVRINVSAAGARNAKNLAGFAHGGVRGLSTAATGGVRNNMTLVGEEGPEIVSMAPGSRVRSNSDTKRLMSGRGGSSAAAQFLFKSSGRRVDDLLLEILREAIQQRGGDPVKVLGG
jgi:predicted RNase H-like nuclease (RuvC/YqgF family)